MKELHCSQVWGGVDDVDLDVRTSGVNTSLFSRSCNGGRGGDIYYFSVCSSDMLTRIVLADVCGHGVEVSEVSAWFYEGMVARMNDLEGRRLLADLNNMAFQRGMEAMATAAVVAFYRANGQLYLSYAGHPPPLIRRHGTVEWVPAELPVQTGPANLPLGVLADVPYDQTEMPLNPGDQLFLYTDGLVEATAPSGELFGATRLRDVLTSAATVDSESVKSTVLAALSDHAHGNLDHDDVTLMVIRVRE